MDIPRLYALRRYWARHPPLREMVQAYLGIKPEGIKQRVEQFPTKPPHLLLIQPSRTLKRT